MGSLLLVINLFISLGLLNYCRCSLLYRIRNLLGIHRADLEAVACCASSFFLLFVTRNGIMNLSHSFRSYVSLEHVNLKI